MCTQKPEPKHIETLTDDSDEEQDDTAIESITEITRQVLLYFWAHKYQYKFTNKQHNNTF